MPSDHEIADDLIPGSLKRSASYHAEYGRMTYGELKKLAKKKPPDKKARQMKKLAEQRARLMAKNRKKPKK
jgi:hypothetical protein